MTYNLFGFSHQSFEQLVQAVAVSTLGPGITVFGKGPDGGREATFDGMLQFPSDSDRWEGYGVVQAKYKVKTEGTSIDQKWVLEQLEAELNAFCNNKKREHLPEYYIFVTNVVLTPFPGTGGKDMANKLIQEYYHKLPLKDHRVWDYDQLCTFLDTYDGIRKRFTVHITPGDVLASLAASIEGRAPDFTNTITAFLEREIRAEQDARLDQGGQRTDERTPLASVFVDLPALVEATQDPPDERASNGKLPPGFLRKMVIVGSQALDPKSLENTSSPIPGRSARAPLINRYVLIGGPGSGKSTLTQFLAQIHRASLLRRRPQHTLLPETKRVIENVHRYCGDQNIPWPTAVRFPVKVALSGFAKSLASAGPDHSATLAEYITRLIRGDRSLRVEDLLQWVSSYPWLLILDGLDEVPASSNRDEVCRKIQDFLAEAAQVNADLLVVSTTRQDGYNNEFGQEAYEYRYLPPLSISRAIDYVRRFATARYGPASPRILEIVSRLQAAAEDPLTAKLMRTPLQVTFMATLAAAGGRPPRDRWRLFHDYYDTIYKREQQKCEGDLRSVLDQHDTIIHRVHHDVGLLLQIQAEQAGSTDAMMGIEQFEQLVDAELARNDWEDPDRSQIRTNIGEAATTRLVFLMSRVARKISFDVRSLQEYMASERIMTGADALVRTRLARIAPIPYWRNVFLFAAGKCFAVPQLEHFRPTIKEICDDLNDGDDPVTTATLAGSRLALDLLEDGTVAHVPRYAKAFTQLALRLADLPPDPFEEMLSATEPPHVRLGRLVDHRTESMYRATIEQRILLGDTQRALGAWALLIELICRNVTWAPELALTYWPKSPDAQLAVLRWTLSRDMSHPWIITRLVELIPQLESPTVLEKCNCDQALGGAAHSMPKWLRTALSLRRYGLGSRAVLRIPGVDDNPVHLHFTALATEKTDPRDICAADILEMPAPSSGWLPYVEGARFMQNPTKAALAAMLRMLPDLTRDEDLAVVRTWLPWPLAVCLDKANADGEREGLARRAESGELGDYADWVTAQRRWIEEGVALQELVNMSDDRVPFDSKISCLGYPLPLTALSRADAKSYVRTATALLDAFAQCKGEAAKAAIGRVLSWHLTLLSDTPGEFLPRMPVEVFRRLVEIPPRRFAYADFLLAFDWSRPLDDDWLSALNALGYRRLTGFRRRIESRQLILPDKLGAAYVLNPSLHGLLRLVAAFTVLGYTPSIPARLLDLDRCSEAPFRSAAIIIRLAQSLCSVDDAKSFAKLAIEIERSSPNAGIMSWMFTLFGEQERLSKVAEAFLITFQHEMVADEVFHLTRCNALLVSALRQRNSGWEGSDTARDFDIPHLTS